MKFEQHFKVEQLNARYAEAIDAGRLEEWPNFFDESGRYTVTTAENLERGLPLCLIYATSRAMLRDRVLFASGRYRDRIAIDDKQSSPRFIERAVILDSRQLDTLLAIPI